MSTFEKRAREDKLAQKARAKQQKRAERRGMPAAAPQIVSAADINGNLRSIEEVMRSISGGEGHVSRAAAPLPMKLFVGSLSSATTSASLRAHFASHGAIAEAVVIVDRNSGESRNFGFVTMVDRKEGPPAISALHGSELDGHRIVVNVATER